jgi:hypothetical protein
MGGGFVLFKKRTKNSGSARLQLWVVVGVQYGVCFFLEASERS